MKATGMARSSWLPLITHTVTWKQKQAAEPRRVSSQPCARLWTLSTHRSRATPHSLSPPRLRSAFSASLVWPFSVLQQPARLTQCMAQGLLPPYWSQADKPLVSQPSKPDHHTQRPASTLRYGSEPFLLVPGRWEEARKQHGALLTGAVIVGRR